MTISGSVNATADVYCVFEKEGEPKSCNPCSRILEDESAEDGAEDGAEDSAEAEDDTKDSAEAEDDTKDTAEDTAKEDEDADIIVLKDENLADPTNILNKLSDYS